MLQCQAGAIRSMQNAANASWLVMRCALPYGSAPVWPSSSSTFLVVKEDGHIGDKPYSASQSIIDQLAFANLTMLLKSQQASILCHIRAQQTVFTFIRLYYGDLRFIRL